MIVITICIDHDGYLIIVIKPGVVYFFYESYYYHSQILSSCSTY